MRRRLDHAPCVTRWAYAAPFAGKRHQKIMAASITTSAAEAVSKDAAFEVFAKRSLDIRRWRVLITLPIKLASRGELKPGFEVVSDGAIEQTLLGMTGLIQRGCLLGGGLPLNRTHCCVPGMWAANRGLWHIGMTGG